MKNGNKIGTFFDRNDLFSKSMPKGNIEGTEAVGTCCGVTLSSLVSILILSFGISRYFAFHLRMRPQISSYTQFLERNETDTINLSENNFRVAFAVETYVDGSRTLASNDTNLVEWAPFFEETTENFQEYKHTPIDFHKCTTDDYKQFYKITNADKHLLENL